MTRYYKILNPHYTPIVSNQNEPAWKEQTWMPPVDGPLKLLRNGYCLLRPLDVATWIRAGVGIWRAEVQDDIVEMEDYIMARSARLVHRLPWNETMMRQFAADCAERALPIYEQDYPDDNRPRMAIEIARQYSIGEASLDEMNAAKESVKAAARRMPTDRKMTMTWVAVVAALKTTTPYPEDSVMWSEAITGRYWQAEKLMQYLGEPPPLVEDE